MTDGENNNSKDTVVRRVPRAGGKVIPQPGGRSIDSPQDAPIDEPIQTIVRNGKKRKKPQERSEERNDDRNVSNPERSNRTHARNIKKRPIGDAGLELNESYERRNILLEEASSLLALGGHLRSADQPRDLNQLRGEIIGASVIYEKTVAGHYDTETVTDASFCICAFLDDCVISTFWGRESQWAKESILAEMHKTTHRERVIDRISEVLKSDATPDLLALYHTVLSLGFLDHDENPQQRQLLQSDVFRALHQYLPENARRLVGPDMVQALEGTQLTKRVSPWILVVATGLLLTLLFYGFKYLLDPAVNDFDQDIVGISDKHAPLTITDFYSEIRKPLVKQINLYQLLAFDIEHQNLSLHNAQPGTRIVMKADGMFGSASANLEPETRFILERIALALRETQGVIQVEGHSDNVPFRSSLTTNQTLSTQRAEQVVAVMSGSISDRSRFRARGLADRVPLDCNDSDEGRKRNRRVEILLKEVETSGAPLISKLLCTGDSS